MGFKKTLVWGFVIVFITNLAILYKTFNPAESNFFPKCPFREVTGLKCPGCGSQRAMHFILNFDVLNAIKENAILVLSIPYVFTGFAFDFVVKPNKTTLKWRKILFGQKAIFVILSIILSFWILRNVQFGQSAF